jgi:hypothetical protein
MTMPTLTRDGRVKIARRILCDYPEMVEGIADAHPDTTGAQFEERCTTVALKEYWARKEVDRGPQPPNSDSFSRFLEVEQLKRGHSSGYVRDPEHVAAMRGALDGKRVDGY